MREQKNGKRKEDRKQRASLTLVFSAFVFAILLIALIIAAGVVFLIAALAGQAATIDTWLILVLMIGISVVMGCSFSLILSRFPLTPINDLINSMNKLARGDFKTRLKFGGILKNNSTFNEIQDSFNRMAEELDNTELLRTDFVNNFSHEFKTPIVSIAGFAKLLRCEDLSSEERERYLTVIEEESRRLSALATNILKLSKIEKQSVIADRSHFNLSEQIRTTVLLLEDKWARRGIVPVVGFDEVEIDASEELLKEIWVNLIDNAIKYSPDCSKIEIAIRAENDTVSVSVTNIGDPIPDEAKEKIFVKFYQLDESHSGEGGGVGLAVVKRVAELHGGTVEVASSGGKNTFTVTLPK